MTHEEKISQLESKSANGFDFVVTPAWLMEQSACKDGYEWACSVIGDGMPLDNFLTKFDRADWMIWTIRRATTMDKIFYVKIAIKFAEAVIDVYEKTYPKDNRPRKAIEAAIAYVKDPSEDNRVAAGAAADSAYAAANAAEGAGAAAFVAAEAADAAYVSANAASAEAAAEAAADAVADAVADAASVSANAAADAAAYADAEAAAAVYTDSAAYAASFAAGAAGAAAEAADYAAANKKMHIKLCAMIIEEISK